VRFAAEAREQGADLVVFPELNLTGHGGHVSMIEAAEPVPGGPSCQRLIERAAAFGLYLCAGVAERDGLQVYNTQFVVGPEGYLGKQRKLFLSSDEYFYFRHGTQQVVFDLPFAKVGIIICFDNEHPEPARCLALQGAELLLCPHAARSLPKWPVELEEERKAARDQLEHWRKVHRCRAWDSAAYVALCNAVGPATLHIPNVQANHAGGCMLVGPRGDVLVESSADCIQEELLVMKVEAKPLLDNRNRPCLPLRVRRPELFAELTRPTA
jgi:predicted amidohydrolase